jgi:hypothetical protein
MLNGKEAGVECDRLESAWLSVRMPLGRCGRVDLEGCLIVARL